MRGHPKVLSPFEHTVRSAKRNRVVMVLSSCIGALVLGLGMGCPEDLPKRPIYRKVGEAPKPKTKENLTEATKKMHAAAKAVRDRRRVTAMRLAFVTDAERACKTDDECTLTNSHCCGCTAMGTMTAIRSDQLKNLIGRRQASRQEYQCAAGMSADPSCAPVSAVCLNNLCVPNPKEMGKAGAGIGVEPITDTRARRPEK